MTGVVRRCGHPTVSVTTCRRPAAWSIVGHGNAVSCWQHAITVAHNTGGSELVHWISGERRAVPARPAGHVKGGPLPTSVDAIVRLLNRARTRPALHRARMAMLQNLAACSEQGLLTPHVGEALARAKSRVGVTASTGVTS